VISVTFFGAGTLRVTVEIAWKEEAVNTTKQQQRTTQELDELSWKWALKLADIDRKEYFHKQRQA
jgi:hypothetical protein